MIVGSGWSMFRDHVDKILSLGSMNLGCMPLIRRQIWTPAFEDTFLKVNLFILQWKHLATTFNFPQPFTSCFEQVALVGMTILLLWSSQILFSRMTLKFDISSLEFDISYLPIYLIRGVQTLGITVSMELCLHLTCEFLVEMKECTAPRFAIVCLTYTTCTTLSSALSNPKVNVWVSLTLTVQIMWGMSL